MKAATRCITSPHQAKIIKLFSEINPSYSLWQTWSDFIFLAATSISNAVDIVHLEEREKAYQLTAKKYSSRDMETFSEIFAEIVLGMEENQDQDFLGEMYMALGLGNDHAGQFFTPYSVCTAMARMSFGDTPARIAKNGWIAVNDPACGAGATLVAFANACTLNHINYQSSVLFVAQDIDITVGLMCYIQLSLLGCPGYVCIGDSIANPVSSYGGQVLLPIDNGNIWYTPFFYRPEWFLRCLEAGHKLRHATSESSLDCLSPQIAMPDQELNIQQNKQLPLDVEQVITPLASNENGQYSLFGGEL